MSRHIIFAGLLTAAILLLSGCSRDDESVPSSGPGKQPEIRVDADIWQMMDATRAATYDSQTALQSEGSFTCGAYNQNTTTPYISPIAVEWNDPNWLFSDGKHYWPISGSLDFFAYMPKEESLPSYVSAVTYAVNGTPAPHFTCADLPIALTTADATKEFVWALAADQDKSGTNSTNQPTAGQVALNFKHPFARIKFKLSAASGTNVKVNSISIPAVYRDGTCTLTGTGSSAVSEWTGLGDNAASLVITGNPATSDETAYLVIPNSYGSQTLTVNATWDDWSDITKNVTASVAFNWQAGYSYTYTLTLNEYALKVDVDKYTEQW